VRHHGAIRGHSAGSAAVGLSGRLFRSGERRRFTEKKKRERKKKMTLSVFRPSKTMVDVIIPNHEEVAHEKWGGVRTQRHGCERALEDRPYVTNPDVAGGG